MSQKSTHGTSGATSRSRLMVVVAAVVSLVAAFAVAPQAAVAGPGSLVSGLAWADTNRDGVRTASEPLRSGVTVQLLTSPGGTVVASTITSATGAYSFPNVADGTYVVRADAPGAFIFPAATSGANDFVRAGAPVAGQPERGVTAPLTITGATQAGGLDAGLQPIADLVVQPLAMANACEGLVQTGTPPFDATDGPGLDSGTSNCIVRTEDNVLQQFSVSLTGLPGDTSVPNVVMEFVISSPDGARLTLSGPGTNGLPAGCLGAANGANPPSSRTINPDGSITVTCNVGTMSSNVGALQVAYRFASDTPVPSHAQVTARAYAAGGEAGASNVVTGPLVEVTGAAEWDLEKVLYPPSGVGNAGPDFTVLTVGGSSLEGYLLRYRFNIRDVLPGAGSSELVWPATFTDAMPEFPNARITECRAAQGADNVSPTSPWTLACPAVTEVQGSDGWQLSVRPNNAAAADLGTGSMIMTVFVPLADMNRAIDPTWVPGEPTPTGSFDYDNRAEDTEHWAINGGALNFGDGHEPGWDGTGNNLATRAASAAAPQWDLQKNYGGNLTFSQQNINGVLVDGYYVDYQFRILDLAGADNVGPWLDRPISFQDRLVSHPGAILLHCRDQQPNPNVAAVNCTPNQVQPAEGWTINPVPNQRGFNDRRMDFIARIFIPLAEMPADPCETGVTLDLRNEAVGSETWTVGGEPNNGTGFEPGWDGTTATGNNLAVNSVRPAVNQCGTITGDKQYIATETGGAYGGDPNNFRASYAGHTLNTRVHVDGSSNRVSATDLQLCDVFDISTQFIRPGGEASITASGSVDPSQYVIEYAVGPNAVDTQAGPFDTSVNLFPSDTTSLTDASTNCRTFAGPWATDPATFGADWRDHVNMIRVRPIDPTLTEVGPFNLTLWSGLQVRGVYNGGPNDGELIPHRIRLSNTGGWPTAGGGWSTMLRERRFEGPQLAVQKAADPTQYLPGDRVVWDLSVLADRTIAGMTMFDVRVVDTVPEGLHFDLACTQSLLPAGVTVTYDSQTRQATFIGGDVPIVSTGTNQWIFHPNAAGARRLRICTNVDSLAQPGDPYTNTIQASASNSTNSPTAQATIQIVGAGQLGITKTVDKQFVATGEDYTWTVDWGNTSTEIAFQPTDIIDVLPWNGDGAPGSGSARTQFESDYTGLAQLTGPLAAPTYVRGGTGGAVPGVWYYSTAAPSTLFHDPRHPSNADPATAGGVWQTAAEIGDFGDVTAVRFVSADFLPPQSRVRATIPMVSTSDDLDNVYVNRAEIFSATFPNQPLLSNEQFVLMPGFTLGDLVWSDRNGNGRFDATEQGVPGVTVQVLDADGNVVATQVTDAAGRWSVSAIPAGTYTVHIPASMFAPGAPLQDFVVRTVGSGTGLTPNEAADNNNTASPDPTATGLTSTPVTLANVRTAGRLTGGNGPTGDDTAGLAGELIPDSFTTFTVDLALLPTPEVTIEKATNGIDADEPTGPLITVGDEVRWTYVVTNTGGVDLTDVTVTDDRVAAGDIDCDGTGSNVIAGPLAPDASFTCVATGTATLGQYANMGTVTGVDPTDVEVSDEDPSHFFGIEPEVDIEKATNTVDADTPTGPLVTVGGDVRWTYVVRNTGNVPLTDVTVTDDRVDAADIDCAGTGSNVVPGPLAPDDTFTCVAMGTATAGQYANLGTVTGTGPQTTDVDGNLVAGATVTDEDASHFFGIEPEVEIEKATNTVDADAPTGPLVTVGGEVRWTYVVRNTGNVPLTDVTVTDDRVGAADIDCDGTGSNVVPGPLAPDDTFTCVAMGTATAGQYANLGTVTGVGPVTTDVDGAEVPGATVTDDDPSHFFGAEPAVRIEKATNGQDADEPTGPFIPIDGAARWTYVVTNTGNVPLTNVTVTDDRVDGSLIHCDPTGTNVIPGPVLPGSSFTCVAMLPATRGQYANLGTVTGVGPVTTDVNGAEVPGVTVSDDDPSHFFGIEPAIDIEKATNTIDADTPTGPIVNEGGQVRWTYVVTNTGNAPLTNIVVTDDLVDAADIDCDGTGGNTVAGPLAARASFSCVATGTAVVGQYANLGSVTGTGPATTDVNGATVAGVEVSDEDPSHYFGVNPEVSIEKSTNGQDADTPTGPLVAVGGTVRWTYVVTNTGDSPLTNVTVTDDKVAAADIDCDGTGSNVIAGPLAPDASFTCVATGTATAGQYANIGTVTGVGPETTDVNGATVAGLAVTDEDPSHYFGVAPAVDIEKATNGQDADEPTGPSVLVGGAVTWTYVVTNTGNVPLTDVTVTDDRVVATQIDCDDTGSNVIEGPLAPEASFTCVATGTATAGQYANLGTVVATGPPTTDVEGNEVAGTSVDDEDWSHYLGSIVPPAAGGLSLTGGVLSPLPVAAGLVLLAGGLLLLILRRRRAVARG